MLTHRARRILSALVAEYIATGEPVASRTLSLHEGLDLSSASVRAVLAELETGGYVLKPHASSGRVPTESAMRLYAEAVVAIAETQSSPLEGEMERRYSEATPGLDALMRWTGKVLAELTGTAAVVMPPRGDTWVLRELRFIWLRPHEILAVIVATTGAVQNRVMRVEHPGTPAELERANNLLRERISGRTLSGVRTALATELEGVRAGDAVVRRALQLGHDALAGVTADAEVLVEGKAQVIERPEFSDAGMARQLVRTLEDHELLLSLLDRTLQAPGMQVLIGSPEGAMASELTLVATAFGSGALGVIGPSRMDYSSVVPLVRQTAARLARRLRD